MSQIVTKEIALQVAKQLLDKKLLAIEKLKTTFKTSARVLYLKTLPKSVINLTKKYPEYINQSSSIQLHGNGWSYEYISFDKSVPVVRNERYWSPDLTISNAIKKDLNIIRDLEKEYRELLKEIEVSLYSLRTYNRVEKEFPEAFKLLPVKQTMALAINIPDIRKKL